MIDLTDTTFRAYKKKSGAISLHLRGYLLVKTNAGFRLSAYLKNIECWLKLPGTDEFKMDFISFSEELCCKYDQHFMLHDVHIATIIKGTPVKSCVADFRMKYHISFTGHPSEEPAWIRKKVPVITRY